MGPPASELPTSGPVSCKPLLAGCLARPCDLDQVLPGREEGQHPGPMGNQELAQPGVGEVPRRDPHDRRGRAVPLEQLDEVLVLGEDRRGALAGGGEDRGVAGGQKAESATCRSSASGLASQRQVAGGSWASTQISRRAGPVPTYATRVGWSKRRAAYCRAAAMSSASR